MNSKSNGNFFVMLFTPKGDFTPLMLCIDIATCESELAKFETKEAARDGALGSVLGEQFGYEIFEIGTGDS
jgi:hypothetical protein